MKIKKIMLLKEFLAVQMNHWILFTILVTVLGLFRENTPDILKWGFLGFFPLLLFGIRGRFHKLLPFLFFHILSAAGMFFIAKPEGIMRVIFIILLLGYMIYSFIVRVRTEDWMDSVMHPCAAGGIVLFMFVLQYFQGKKEWSGYYIVVLIVFLGMYFIYYYIHNYECFLAVNANTASRIPKQEIFRSGMGLTIVYSIFSIVILTLVVNINWLYTMINRLLEILKQGLVWMIRWLIGLLSVDTPPPGKEEMIVEPFSQNTGFAEPTENFWLWVWLEKIIMFLFYCLLIGAAIVSLINLIRFIYERFIKKRKKPKPEHFVAGDIREKCEIIRKEPKKKTFAHFFTNKERIRRIYKKQVLERKKRFMGERDLSKLPVLTARECSRFLEMEGLTDFYEKARYSEQECTADDVKAAKHGIHL